MSLPVFLASPPFPHTLPTCLVISIQHRPGVMCLYMLLRMMMMVDIRLDILKKILKSISLGMSRPEEANQQICSLVCLLSLLQSMSCDCFCFHNGHHLPSSGLFAKHKYGWSSSTRHLKRSDDYNSYVHIMNTTADCRLKSAKQIKADRKKNGISYL